MIKRIRVTQIFPFLLPLRIKTKKWAFYRKMSDEHSYGLTKVNDDFPYEIAHYRSNMVNHHSGYSIVYQYNKVHNLHVASKPIDHIVIKPHQIFSLCRLIRHADQLTPYKDGLITVDEVTKPSYGGGLCQLSNMLYWVFLHSPLTILERHPHNVETIPQDPSIPYGIDATIAEGWCDLKVKNDSDHDYQIIIDFDDDIMKVTLLSTIKEDLVYTIYNQNLKYFYSGKHLMQQVDVYRNIRNGDTTFDQFLYTNTCEIGYPLTKAQLQLNAGQIKEVIQ